MPTELEKRAAKLAVSRYGADAARVDAIWKETAQARQAGFEADFLDSLVESRLLTPSQAAQLREALDQTQVAAAEAPKNGDAVDLRIRTPVVAPEPLARIGGCRILRKLGEGGMGTVFLAYQETFGRQVAVKVLADHLAGNPAIVERFEREAVHAFKLDHVNIVRGLGVGTDEPTGKHYLIMEYVDGISAQHLLDERGKLEVPDAVHIVRDIAQALEHVQSRNIVHRDIKPENILITRTGVAKLSDLGLAKQTNQASHLTATRQSFGTPYYMPYEQAINAKLADGRSDIFALGATFYHLLTGQVPFPGQTQLEILEKKEEGAYRPASLLNPRIPESIDRILDKMLARDPRDRYQTASELIVDLDRSGLNTPLLSFADHELALRDPVVRARAVGVGLTTQPDLQRGLADAAFEEPDFWFVRLYDRNGKWRQAKATTWQILQQIQKGRLTATARAAHVPEGPYRQLDVYPAFRSAIREQDRIAAKPPARPVRPASRREPGRSDAVRSSNLLWLAAGAAAAAVLVLGIAYLIGS